MVFIHCYGVKITTDESCTYFLSVLPANATFVEKEQATPQASIPVEATILVINTALGIVEIMSKLGLSDRKHFRKEYLLPSIEGGYIEMTIPNKPSSPNQKYRLTQKGILLKAKLVERE